MIDTSKHIYAESMTIDIDFYCRCGARLGFYDSYCGGPGYNDWGEQICPNCGQVWWVTVKVEPIDE